MRRSFAHASRDTRSSPSLRAAAARTGCGFKIWTARRRTRSRRPDLHGVSLAGECGAEETRVRRGQPAAERRRDRQRAEARGGRDVSDGEARERPRRHLLQAEDVRIVGGRERDHLVDVGAPSRGPRVAVVEVPAPDEHPFYATSVRVVVADPPAFTPWYDHELAAALARAGADVELVTSPFRFGTPPEPDGYTRKRRFYPMSSKLFRRSRLRLPVKGVEHLGVVASLSRLQTDVLHVQWLAFPQLDAHLRFRSPSVFTAHDLLPRRTASKRRSVAADPAALRPRRRAQRARARGARRARRRARR